MIMYFKKKSVVNSQDEIRNENNIMINIMLV